MTQVTKNLSYLHADDVRGLDKALRRKDASQGEGNMGKPVNFPCHITTLRTDASCPRNSKKTDDVGAVSEAWTTCDPTESRPQ